ncbi:2504_t:CDS:2, partial [Entrophospora sp. SA101]
NDGDSSLFTKTDDSSSTESTSPPRNNNDHQYEKIKSNEPEKPDNLFLCTISNQSHIVNIKAELYQYNRTIKWSNPPDNVCILPTKDDVLVVAFEKNLIEIATNNLYLVNDGDSSLFTKTDDSSSTESTSPPRNNNDHQYEKIKSNEPEKPDNLFLCTISNQSHIVNIKAELYQYNRTIKWSNPPDNVCILPTKDDVLVVAFEKNLIEIATLKHGEIIKREAKGVPVRFLD